MRYDRQTLTLMEEIRALDESLDEDILKKLPQLENTATALNDDFLLGFTYYYYAFAKYNFGRDRSDFTQDLSLAVHHLMRTSDHDLLSRVFTLVAIDAFSYGSYDVAYNYYMHALHEAVADENIVAAAILETNLALIFMELRDYRQAKKHIRTAIRYLKKVADHSSSHFSLHAAYVDDAAISLELNDLAGTKKALKQAMRYVPKESAPGEDLKLSLAMLHLRLAYAEGDEEAGDKLADDLIGCLLDEPCPEGYAGDIRALGNWLLENGYTGLTGRIIDTVNDRILSSGMVHVIRIFTMLKVDYANACGDAGLLNEALESQQAFLQSQRSNLNRIHKYTLDLVRIDNSIRNEQIQIREENQQLKQKAYHDALTGIANRHMLDKMLEAAFERAYQTSSPLGVEILDIDYFKEYNDIFGHPEGDTCLIAIAAELDSLSASELPAGASVFSGRYGGDEFVILYEGLTEEEIRERAQALAMRIKNRDIRHPGSLTGDAVTISQGICVATPVYKQKVWDYLSEADRALYEVKQARTRKEAFQNGIAIRTIGGA